MKRRSRIAKGQVSLEFLLTTTITIGLAVALVILVRSAQTLRCWTIETVLAVPFP